MNNQERQDNIYNKDILKSSNIIRTIFSKFSSGATINSLEKTYLHIFSTKLVFLLVNSIDYSGPFSFMSGYSLHLKNNINKLNDRLKRDKIKKSKSNTKMNNTIIYDKKIGKNIYKYIWNKTNQNQTKEQKLK